MSELTNQVRRMLNQAQRFAADAPLEAVSRVLLALRTAREAFPKLGAEEQAELATLIELSEERVQRYQLALANWSSGVRARADQYTQNERARLQQPLPSKG